MMLRLIAFALLASTTAVSAASSYGTPELCSDQSLTTADRGYWFDGARLIGPTFSCDITGTSGHCTGDSKTWDETFQVNMTAKRVEIVRANGDKISLPTCGID